MTGLMDRGAFLSALGVQWSYIAVMFVAVQLLWRAGMRRFVAFGG